MRRITSYLVALIWANLLSMAVLAQSPVTISGNVKNASTSEGASSVSVSIKGTSLGTFTDDKGNFTLNVKKLPVTLVFSSVGYEMQEITVSSASQAINISFKPASTLGQDIVVSATRVATRILESPVSIERVTAAAIRNAPAVSYYDILSSLKGVDVTTSSLTFKTPTTRGFNGSGSTRVTQIVDGMDNQAPGLNFSVGSVIGLTELDVDNVELLPGASSALYGPGGMNGTILISSKSPFKYQGLSFVVKEGIMNTDKRFRGASPYSNWSLRWAKKIGEKFAFKIGTELVAAKDWLGSDNRNYLRTGTEGKIINGDRATDPNYDGVNVYGDETTIDIRTGVLNTIALSAPFLRNFIDTLNNGKAINVSRTGYAEKDVVNPNTVNYKISAAFHYKVSPSIEAVLSGYWGTGNTVYTGSERYSLKDLKVGQYKFELNHKNWMLRAYTTQENAGESYNATVTSRLFNEAWKPSGGSTGWFSSYSQTYLGARLNGLTDFDAQTLARSTADVGRPVAGSDQFKSIFNQVRSVPISKGGGLFVDKTDLYMLEGQANISKFVNDFAEVIIGANYKRYVLNSEGTLFADSTGKIPINEYGAYLQATKKLFNERLKLSFSGRYDKNENFKGRFTPRVTALIKVGETSNIRISYQSAYRFPSTQQQWINLNIGSNTRLLGGNTSFQSFYKLNTKPTFLLSALPSVTSVYQFPEYKPESVNTYELGYKGLLADGKLLIDAYGYFGQYQDFITRTLLIQPNSGNVQDVINALANNVTVSNVGQIFSVPINSSSKVKTYGFGLGLDYRLPFGFIVSGNVSSDTLSNVPNGFKASFSTPRYRTNFSIANNGFGFQKRMGFNVTYRWQKGFMYESDFTNDYVNNVNTVDAQFSYKFPSTKSILKIGANNLLNEYYINGAGNSIVGGLYYISFGYNLY